VLAAPPALAAAIEVALQRAIQRGALPSGVVLIRHNGGEMLRAAYGHSFAYDSKTSPATEPIAAAPDTLYDFASLTKLFTATCVMRLVEQGRCGLDEHVARYVPAFGAAGKGDITVRQLLTHTSGLPALLQLWKLESTPEARLRRVLEVKPTDPPDSVFRYSDLGYMVLGRLVEEVAGLSLDRAVRTWITEPLGLESIGFLPPIALKARIAATEDQDDPPRGLIWGEVHDPSAWSLGGVAGHAGLFGSARDLATFGQVYLDGGGALLRPETVAEMTRGQIGKLGRRGLGWELNESFYMGHLASPSTFGHTGFTGTSLVIAPRQGLVVVLLTNRVHPTVDGPSINSTRQAVSDAALAAAEAA
jgi:CubicO group peptidase (beta-lactamase class C family)